MSPIPMENGNTTIFEMEGTDLSRLLNRHRPINIERNRSFEERSFSEMSITFSPRHSRIIDHLDGISGFTSPRSHSLCEPHPMTADAWENLRRSLVNFRGQPVGTIAALDHSVEELNYDQVLAYTQIYCSIALLIVVHFSVLNVSNLCRTSSYL